MVLFGSKSLTTKQQVSRTEPPEVKAIYKAIRKTKETTDDSMKGMLEWTRLFHSLDPSVPQRDRPKFLERVLCPFLTKLRTVVHVEIETLLPLYR